MRLHQSDHDEFRVPVYDNQIAFTLNFRNISCKCMPGLGIMVLFVVGFAISGKCDVCNHLCHLL